MPFGVPLSIWDSMSRLAMIPEFSSRPRLSIWYLLTATIAQRLAAGDLELVEKGDSCGKKAYYDKLCREIRRDYGE